MRYAAAILLALSLVGLSADTAVAQDAEDVLGGVAVGALISLPVALGYSALRAQSGDYVWNGSESVSRAAVVGVAVIGISAGVAVGANERFDIGDALGGAILGGAAGALLGRGIAQFTSEGSEGRWAGTLMGMGAGTLIGSIWATVARAEDPDPEPVPLVSVALPLSLPGSGR